MTKPNQVFCLISVQLRKPSPSNLVGLGDGFNPTGTIVFEKLKGDPVRELRVCSMS
jgi:hypothetical protein